MFEDYDNNSFSIDKLVEASKKLKTEFKKQCIVMSKKTLEKLKKEISGIIYIITILLWLTK